MNKPSTSLKNRLRIAVVKTFIVLSVLSIFTFLLIVRYLSVAGLILAAIVNIPALLYLVAVSYANNWLVLPKKTPRKKIQHDIPRIPSANNR